MSFPLPYVLVLLNLSRRPAIPPGEAARRAVVRRSLSLLARLMSSCSLLPIPLLYSSGETLDDVRASDACDYCGCADVMWMSCGCVFLGSLCSPSAYRPAARHGWRGGERMSSLLASFGFLLRCANFVDRVICGCRGCFAMVYCHCVVGGG